MKKLLLVLCLFSLGKVGLGQQIENFTLTNATNGQTISLNNYPSCAGLVIIFSSNTCPYDEYYRNRIKKLIDEVEAKVPVLLVNSNTEPAESVENMAKKAKQLGISVPYLADKDQTLMTQLKATKNPQAFLLKNNGGKFNVVYSGAIDDNAQVEADVKHHYLRDAIDILLANQTISTAEVRPPGCTIRKK